jgi:hypothetical protein
MSFTATFHFSNLDCRLIRIISRPLPHSHVVYTDTDEGEASLGAGYSLPRR